MICRALLQGSLPETSEETEFSEGVLRLCRCRFHVPGFSYETGVVFLHAGRVPHSIMVPLPSDQFQGLLKMNALVPELLNWKTAGNEQELASQRMFSHFSIAYPSVVENTPLAYSRL